MAQKPIYNCFHPALQRKSDKIEEFDKDLENLVSDLYDTMYGAENGIGLAAPQIGVNKRLFVIDTKLGQGELGNSPMALINPEIVEFSDEVWTYQEGCLSVPTVYEDIERPKRIVVKYFDTDGKEHNMEADELLSRVIQHELDHLDGILFYEKISSLRRAMIKTKLKKIQRGKIEIPYPMIMPDGSLQD